jgi:hypothetical protein
MTEKCKLEFLLLLIAKSPVIASELISHASLNPLSGRNTTEPPASAMCIAPTSPPITSEAEVVGLAHPFLRKQAPPQLAGEGKNPYVVQLKCL